MVCSDRCGPLRRGSGSSPRSTFSVVDLLPCLWCLVAHLRTLFFQSGTSSLIDGRWCGTFRAEGRRSRNILSIRSVGAAGGRILQFQTTPHHNTVSLLGSFNKFGILMGSIFTQDAWAYTRKCALFFPTTRANKIRGVQTCTQKCIAACIFNTS